MNSIKNRNTKQIKELKENNQKETINIKNDNINLQNISHQIKHNFLRKHSKYYICYFIQFIGLVVYDLLHLSSLNLLLHTLIFFIEFLMLFLLLAISSLVYNEIEKELETNPMYNTVKSKSD